MRDIVDTIRQSELVQIDSSRGVVFETPPDDVVHSISKFFDSKSTQNAKSFSAHDSDSGDSLFLTQSVTPVHRRHKRHQLRKSLGFPFDLESEDDTKRASDVDNVPHDGNRKDVLPGREINAENNEDDLPAGKPVKKARGSRKCSRTPRNSKIKTPFLTKKRQHLTCHDTQIVVHSEVGGFFKCLKKICSEREEGRKELDPSLFLTVLQDDMNEVDLSEENSDFRDEQDDVRVVDTNLFIKSIKRNRQSWLTKRRKESSMSSRKTRPDPEEEKRLRDERGRRRKPRHTESQKPTETSCDSKTTRNERNIIADGSNGFGSTCLPSSPEAPVAKTFFSEVEERGEMQLEVLAACTQSLDLLHGRDFARAEENSAAGNHNDDESHCSAIEETQRPEPREEETDESLTPDIILDRSDKRNDGDDRPCLEDVIFRNREEIQQKAQDVEDEGRSDGEIGSQDLFLQPESPSLLQVVTDAITEVENRTQTDHTAFLKSNGTPRRDIASLKARELSEPWKQESKKTAMNQSEVVVPPEVDENEPEQPRPSVDVGTSPRKQIIEHEEKAQISLEGVDIQFFNYDGVKFLKRKKRRAKKELPIDPALSQPGLEKSESLAKPTTAKKNRIISENLAKTQEDVGSRTLGKAVDSFLENVVSDAFSSPDGILDSEAPGPEEGRVKEREKKKRDKNVLSEPNHEGTCIDDGGEQPNLFSTSSSHEEVTENAEENCVQLDDFEPPRKKKKKVRKRDLRPERDDDTVTVICDKSHGTSETKVLKKKTKIIENADGENQNSEIAASKFQCDPEANVENESSIAVQEGELMKKKKKKKNRRKEVVEEQAEIEAGEVENISDHPGTVEEVQDSCQEAAEVVLEKKVKKKKKKKISCDPEATQEDDIQTACLTSESVAVSCGPEDCLVLKEGELLQRKKKKKRRMEVVEEQADDIENTDHVENEEAVLDSVLEAPEVVLEKKVKRKMKKRSADCDPEAIQKKVVHIRCSTSEKMPISDGFENQPRIDPSNLRKKTPLVGNSSETYEVGQCPHDLELTPQKKKKKRKKKTVGSDPSSSAPDNIGHVECDEVGRAEQTSFLQDTDGERRDEEITASKENDLNRPQDELVPQKKKKKKKKKEEVSAGAGEIETVEAVQDSGLEAPEVVLERKVKKKRWSKSCETERTQEERQQTPRPASEDESLHNGHKNPPRTDSPNPKMKIHQKGSRAEIDEAGCCSPAFGGLTPIKKRKKKKKNEVENELSSLTSGGASSYLEAEVIPESSPARDKKKKKKRKGLTMCPDSTSGQSIVQDEKVPVKKKKDKDKKKSGT